MLSPGFTNSRSTLTALAEDLASHGYVVAGIDHTYESYATAFPDGRVTTCLAREAPRRDRKEEVAAGRAADVCFVLDELTGAHPAWPGAGLIDPSRMAMAGHAGGAAAIAAMLADSRIRAGIDMDGSTAAPIPDEGLARPFLFLGKQSNYTPGSGGAVTTLRDWKLLRGAVITWERDWKLLTGWKRWLVVAGAVHASFTDLALLADQTGIDTGAGLSGARSLDITRAYVRAFFDQHLRGRPQPCWTSRHHATPRSHSVPRRRKPAPSTPAARAWCRSGACSARTSMPSSTSGRRWPGRGRDRGPGRRGWCGREPRSQHCLPEAGRALLPAVAAFGGQAYAASALGGPGGPKANSPQTRPLICGGRQLMSNSLPSGSLSATA